ncbi:MAG: hypothetical protein GVY34_08570 [Alphaproteobacteria bacterium]|nr:hypothetical protein [Alphaproteobacteria bacterium]
MHLCRIPLATLLLGVAACSAGAADPGDGSSAPRIGCELVLQERSRMLILQAHAHADQPGHGHYTLELTRHASGGSADIRQSGDVDLPRQGRTLLTEIQLSDTTAPFTADLNVTIRGQTVTCTRAGL